MDNSRLEFKLNHNLQQVYTYYATDTQPNTIEPNVDAIATLDKHGITLTAHNKIPAWAMRKIRMAARTFVIDTSNNITDLLIKQDEYPKEKNGLIPFITMYIPEDNKAYYDVAYYEKGTPFNIELNSDDNTTMIPVCYLYTSENKIPVYTYIIDVVTPEGSKDVLRDSRTIIHATNGNLITIERINRNSVIMRMDGPNKEVWFSRTHEQVKAMVKNGHVNII